MACDLPGLIEILRANGLVLRSARFGSVSPGSTGDVEFTCDPLPDTMGGRLADSPLEEPTDPNPDVLESFLRKKAARGTD